MRNLVEMPRKKIFLMPNVEKIGQTVRVCFFYHTTKAMFERQKKIKYAVDIRICVFKWIKFGIMHAVRVQCERTFSVKIIHTIHVYTIHTNDAVRKQKQRHSSGYTE